MKKKLFIAAAFILISVSLLTGLAACNVNNGEITTLSIWHYYNNEQQDAFSAIVEEFNNTVGKQKRIRVNEYSQGYVNDVAEKVIASAKEDAGAEPMPNIFMAYADTAYTVDKLGKVASLDPYFTAKELDDYVGAFINVGRFDGKNLKIFPIAKSTEIFMINMTDWNKFAEANPSVSLDMLSTIEGIMQVSEIYYDWSGGKAFYGRDSLSNYFIIGAKSLGIDLMYRDENGNFRVNFDRGVFRKLWESYYVPYVKGHFASNGRFRSSDVSSGDILCYTGSSSSSLFFPSEVITDDDDAYAIDHYVTAAPKFADGENYAVQQGAGLVVTKSDEKTEKACAEFLKWFTSKDVNAKFAVDSSYLPVKKSTLSSNYLEESVGLDKRCYDSLKVSTDIINNSTLYTNITSEYGNSVRDILDNHIEVFAKKARADYLNDLKAGAAPASAIGKYISDAAFDTWFADIKANITAVYSE